MVKVLRNRNFALLSAGQFISALGDWGIYVALPFYVYNTTNSVLATGTMFFVETIPRLFVGTLGGIFVDRVNRKKILIYTDIARSLLILLLLIAQSLEYIWIIYIVGFTESFITELFVPSKNAMIPSLVDTERLSDANSVDATNEAITRLIGPPLGGWMMSLFGFIGIIIFDSISFLFSAAMVLLISVRIVSSGTYSTDEKKKFPYSIRSLWYEWLEGLFLIKSNIFMVLIFAITFVMMLGQGMINVLFIPFINDVLKSGALGFGWFISIQGVGALVGSMLVSKIMRIIKPITLISVSTSISGAIFLMIIYFSDINIAIFLNFFVGILAVFFMVGVNTEIQKKVMDGYLGRIFGTYNTLKALALIIGIIIASLLGKMLSTVMSLAIAGIMMFAAGGLPVVMQASGKRHF